MHPEGYEPKLLQAGDLTPFPRENLHAVSDDRTLHSTMIAVAKTHRTRISNDGDALFPAVAKAPRAAALATFYSAVPAIIVAYGTYALGW